GRAYDVREERCDGAKLVRGGRDVRPVARRPWGGCRLALQAEGDTTGRAEAREPRHLRAALRAVAALDGADPRQRAQRRQRRQVVRLVAGRRPARPALQPGPAEPDRVARLEADRLADP